MRTKTAITVLLLCSALIGSAVVGPFETMTFAWDRASSHGTNITFRLKYGTSTNNYPWFIDVGTNTIATVTNATSGYLYFIVVARTHDGLESDPSNLVNVTNYPASPLRLRMVTNTYPTVKLEGTLNGGVEWRTLALVTNEPAFLKGGLASMMLRASTNYPPIPQ